jgi:hypothetical protein
MGLSIVPRARLSLRALPQSIFFIPDLPAHCAFQRTRTITALFDPRVPLKRDCTETIIHPAIDFHSVESMITGGDGVRLITAVLRRTDDDS